MCGELFEAREDAFHGPLHGDTTPWLQPGFAWVVAAPLQRGVVARPSGRGQNAALRFIYVSSDQSIRLAPGCDHVSPHPIPRAARSVLNLVSYRARRF